MERLPNPVMTRHQLREGKARAAGATPPAIPALSLLELNITVVLLKYILNSRCSLLYTASTGQQRESSSNMASNVVITLS